MADTSNYYRSPFMQDAFIDNATSLGANANTFVSNVARSGQLGTGSRYNKLDAATPMVFRPTQIVVLQLPTMWDAFRGKQEVLRSLIETHAKSVNGIDVSYELGVAQTPVGHDGQQMEIPTKTTRAQVSPTFTFIEYTGMPVYNIFKDWMFAISDPDTNGSRLTANFADMRNVPGWSMSMYSMSILCIQYDPTGIPSRVQDACVICNMFPKQIGGVGFERTIGNAAEKERQISFTGLVQHNENTRNLGITVASMLQLHRINYDFALPGLTGSVDANVAIDPKIRSYGGLEYEAGSTNKTPVPGSIQQFRDGNAGLKYPAVNTGGGVDLKGEYIFRNEVMGSETKIAATGAATSDITASAN